MVVEPVLVDAEPLQRREDAHRVLHQDHGAELRGLLVGKEALVLLLRIRLQFLKEPGEHNEIERAHDLETTCNSLSNRLL